MTMTREQARKMLRDHAALSHGHGEGCNTPQENREYTKLIESLMRALTKCPQCEVLKTEVAQYEMDRKVADE